MMGKALTDSAKIERAAVTKTTGNILVLPLDHVLFRKADMPTERLRARAKSCCLQCQACTDLCPRHMLGHNLRPHLLMRNFIQESFY